MIKKIRDYLKKRLRNDKGEGMTSQMIGIAIGVLLTMTAVTAGITGINKAKESRTLTTLKDFSSSIELMLVDHSKLQLECGQTFDSTTGTYSAIDGAVTGKYIEIINKYLDESLQFDPDTCQSRATDGWDMPFELYISTQDIDYDPDTDTATVVSTNSEDTEIRIIIKSLGKDSKIQRTAGTNASADGCLIDDKDDKLIVIQNVNGTIKSGSYGFETVDTVHFANDSDGARALDECIVF